MDLGKSFQFCFIVVVALFSLDSTAASPEYVPGEVLIVPDGTFQATSVQALGMSVKDVYQGKTSFSRIEVKPGQSVEDAIQALKRTSGIIHAEPNYIYHAAAVPTDPAFTTDASYWGLQNTGQTVNGTTGTSGADIDAVSAWDIRTDCATVTVAVVDSGIDYNHPDLAANIWSNSTEVAGNIGVDDDGNGFIDDIHGWDFVYSDNNPMDVDSHGTYVAGTIGAVGTNGIGGVGVCWTASIMPVKVLDGNGNGNGTIADIVSGVDYAVANGARIINLSFGSTDYSSLFNTAIANANSDGVLVVTAAGNDGMNNDSTPVYPASYKQPNIISVAATDQNDALTSFTNHGANSVDVAAPGINIYSTIPGRTPVCSWNFDDGTNQGWVTSTYDYSTSMTVTDTMGLTTSRANSGLYSLTDSVGGNYANNHIYTASSPVCDLTGVNDAKVELAVNMNVEYYDSFDLLASDNGTTWSSLLDSSYYDSSTLGSWVKHSVDLNAWENSSMQLRWTLNTNGSGVDDGIYVDDIVVTKPITSGYTGSEYAFYTGTSMATAYVTGVAALTLAANPGLSVPGDVSQLRSRVIESGEWMDTLDLVTVSGKRINANNALSGEIISGLTATVNGSQVELAWGDITTESTYQIWRKINSGSFISVASGLAANSTSYSDAVTLPATDTSYTYQVRATTPSGTIYSNAAAVATLPIAAGGLAATYSSSGSYVALAWNDNSQSETAYQVKRDGVEIATLSTDSTSYYDTDVSAETTYSYDVFAVNAAGSIASDSTVSVTTPIAATTDLSATSISSSQIRLSWTDNSSIETSYLIEEYDYSSATYSTVASVTANSTNYTVSGLQPSTYYWYRVTAVGASSSAPSTVFGTYTQSASSSSSSSSGGGGGGGAWGGALLLLLVSLFYRLAPMGRGKA